ncbi:uncharacterized protein LOC133199049 [Saccostrea echinata]|uniref:uncharacterized protein LOC133199049 n=1 Tax=Saccostrea echinata TaxID=191078 RepID=UPI002A7F203D|nr:uncharacterized protein LOC133199049 [Saccostrea echinata]
MYDSQNNRYSCTCIKIYKTRGHFKRHLEKEHGWDFALNQDSSNSTVYSKMEHVAVWRASFIKLSLLLRDTEDAFHYGDGYRIFRNVKFEMLCADAAHHAKYRLWLWHMQAYESAILTQRQAVEYKWNCTANTHGGKGKNIPNDNLVETLVQKIKKKLREQVSNLTHNSAQRIALSIQIQEELKENVLRQFSNKEKGRSRPTVNRDSELHNLITELQHGEVSDVIQGREFHAFRRFSDLFSKVKAEELHKWISDQKFRASYEMF